MENNKPTNLKEELNRFIDVAINSAETAIKSVIQNLKQKAYEPTTLEKFANSYIEPTDKALINELKNTKLKYIGGDLKLYYIDESYFGIVISWYFKNEEQKFIKRKYEYKYNNKRHLTEEAFNKLKEKRTIMFELEPPSLEDIKASSSDNKYNPKV